MQRLAGLVVLATLAIPADASHPHLTRQEKPRPTQSAEPPLAVPLPIPPSTPTTILDERVLETILCPNQALAKWVVTRVFGDPNDPNWRMERLLKESEDLSQAREEFHRFWMNNQPSVLSYERLNGAIGP
jgi:hypothetical protein